MWSYLTVPLIFLLLKVLLIDPQLTPLRQTQLQNGALQNVERPTQIDYGDQLRLLGYSVSPDHAQPRAGRRNRARGFVLARAAAHRQELSNDGGSRSMRTAKCGVPRRSIGRATIRIIRPTSTWPADAYVVDSFELPINPGTPPGQYQIFAEVFERGSLLPLPAQAVGFATHVTSVGGAPRPAGSDPRLRVLSLRTSWASTILHADRLLTPEIKLLGANRDRDQTC